ncbi:MAG TPA: RNA polymerase sigma factor [Polyangiales bacterium]
MDPLDPLVRRAQAGDERALHELFVRHRQDVARIVFRALGPDGDVDDVVQDAFIQIFRSIGRFRGNSKFSTWLYRVVTNVARMHLRSRRARPQIASGVAPEDAKPASLADGPEQEAERHARLRALYRQLDQLSEKKRTVLVLHDFEGLSPAEIGEIVEAPVLTVRTRLFYARKELYAALATDPVLAEVAEQVREAASGGANAGKRAGSEP